MSVKVAVRVRPFNNRELELKCENCVEMIGNTTTLKDPNTGNTRDFTFDYSFWSHDDFETKEDGLYVALSDKYADQQRVFDCVGEEVLKNAWSGYHCCLFAYGQTGSGKSYSMVGYGPNKGIVPITCDEIFKRIKSNDDPKRNFEIQFSMLEIYNEKIQDLLIAINKRPTGGLKVREHKTHGVFVEDLTKHPVDSYEGIVHLTDLGNRNRTIGSTLMNACSSRAHTIISIEFKQIETLNGRKTEKLSIIYLVDLAGSEKLSKTGATGDRMKEGCSINKSLTVLGIVISNLADKATGKGKNIVIPYRDSVLTRILQNALGGNSKTLMICALSPASNNYDETLSTLRYADQAKKIKNCAIVNESEQDKMIRELQGENEKLKELLSKFQGPSGMSNMMLNSSMMSSTNNTSFNDDKYNDKIKEMEEQLRANAMLMKEYETSFQQKMIEAKEMEDEQTTVDMSCAHLININEDPSLNGKVIYSLKDQFTYVGKKTGSPVPQIILGSIGIKPNHALLKNEFGKLYVEPFDAECGETIFINGDKALDKKELHDKDRLIFGGTACFLVRIPQEENELYGMNEKENKKEIINDFDWEYIQKELMAKADNEKKKKEEAIEKEREKQVQIKIKKLEEQFKYEKESTEVSMKKQQDEFDNKIKELEDRMVQETEKQKLELEKKEAERQWKENLSRIEAERTQRELEREKQKKEIQEEENLKRYKIKEKNYLENKLSRYLPKILEVNLIAKEIKRNVSFQAKLMYFYVDSGEVSSLIGFPDKNKKMKIQIQVNNKEEGTFYYWNIKKFLNRYFIIKEILDRYFETNQIPILSKEDDPFWDPAEQHLIGQGYLKMLSLVYLVDNPADLNLVGDNGTAGSLSVNLIPTDESGTKNLSDMMEGEGEFIDDPLKDIMGKRLDFLVKIDCAKLPPDFCRDSFVEYALMNEELKFENFRTPVMTGKNQNPNYLYNKLHFYKNVSDKILDYLMNSNITFYVYGYEDKLTSSMTRTNSSSEKKNSLEIPEIEKFKKKPSQFQEVHLKEFKDENKAQINENRTQNNPNIQKETTTTTTIKKEVVNTNINVNLNLNYIPKSNPKPDAKTSSYRDRSQSEIGPNFIPKGLNAKKEKEKPKEKDCRIF